MTYSRRTLESCVGCTVAMTNVYTESWLVGPQSTKFYTRTYLPPSQPKAAVVFVHGFAEHIGRYTHFHPLFAAKGIAIFTYDQRGYGLTAQDTGGNRSKDSAYGKTSWKEQMEDIAWAVQYAKTTFGSVPLFLMGHSMVCDILGIADASTPGYNVSGRRRISWFWMYRIRESKCVNVEIPLRDYRD